MTPVALRATAQYQALARAVSDLLNAHRCGPDELRWAWRTPAIGDYCDPCDRRDDVDDPTCWPLKTMDDGRYLYRCPRCGHVWTCGWGASALNGRPSNG